MSTRTRTVLFTDIVGSTQLFAGLGDRAADQLLLDHFGDLREALQHFGGVELKTLGDGLMASFDAAGDAVEAAIAMQHATLSRGPAGEGVISIRVGISSGDVQLEGSDCHGIAVVEASRLCAAAAGGQVLLSHSTRLLIRGGRAVLKRLGEVQLRGLPEPVETWQAEVAVPATARLRVVLADDAVLVREGIAQVLERAGLEVVGQAGGPDEVVQLASELRPHVAVIDLRMPPTNTQEGLDAAERMRAADPKLGVLLLSQDVDPHSARRLLAVGQQGLGYLLKERVANIREFAAAVRRVAAGGTAFEAAVISSLEGGRMAEGGIRELSGDECDALAAGERESP